MKKRVLAGILSLCMAAALLAGCGSSGNGSGQGAQTAGESDHKANNEIVIGIPQDLDANLDPHVAVAAGTKEVMFNVFEGLVKYDSKGDTIPAVASDVKISEDGLTYTFTLRDGIKFHNGEAVDLDDVIYSITRCRDDVNVNPQTRTGLACIASLEKQDDKTLVMTLSEPNTELMSLLTLAILPSDYESQDVAPIGTGPYKFVSRTAQESVVLERFADYWGTPGYIDKVTYKINEKIDGTINGLNSGAIDLVSHLTTVQTRELNADEFNIEKGAMNLVQALYLNNEAEPFDDIRVRQALCYAIDRQNILDMAFDGEGFLIGSNVFPSFEKYFDDSLTNYYEKDLKKARELLTEAGYPNGFEMTITAPSNYDPHVATAEVIVEQLKEVGITAKVEKVDWTKWKDETYVGRKFQATVIGLTADPLTARSLLERFTTGQRVEDEDGNRGNNFINYNNAEYDELFEKAITCYDDAEQTEIYKALERNLTENAASVYIQDMADMVAVRKGLTGLQFYPLYVLDVSTLKWE